MGCTSSTPTTSGGFDSTVECQDLSRLGVFRVESGPAADRQAQLWRIRTPSTSTGWAWDVQSLRVYHTDGVLVPAVRAFSSGSASDGPDGVEGYSAEEAVLRPELGSCWGGRQDPRPGGQFWLAVELRTPVVVEALEINQCSPDHFTDNVIVEAQFQEQAGWRLAAEYHGLAHPALRDKEVRLGVRTGAVASIAGGEPVVDSDSESNRTAGGQEDDQQIGSDYTDSKAALGTTTRPKDGSVMKTMSDQPDGNASTAAGGAGTTNEFVGQWITRDLPTEGDPCRPDEELLTITESTVEFDNGGGGFANGPYKQTALGTIEFSDRQEKIRVTARRLTDSLDVRFSGGRYGTAGVVASYERR